MAEETNRRRASEQAWPVRQADDHGLAGAEPANTTDREPDSALGGGTATRSGTAPDTAEAAKRSQ